MMDRDDVIMIDSSPEPEIKRPVRDILERCYQSRSQLVVATYEQRSYFIMQLANHFRDLGQRVLILTSHDLNTIVPNRYSSEIAYYVDADESDGNLTRADGIDLQNINHFYNLAYEHVNTITGQVYDSINLDLLLPKNTVVLIDDAELVATNVITRENGKPVELPLVLMLLCASRASHVYLFTSSPVSHDREDLKSLLFLLKGISPPGTNNRTAFNDLSIAGTKRDLIANWTCLVSIVPTVLTDNTNVNFPSKVFERIEVVMTPTELKAFENKEREECGWQTWGNIDDADDEGIISYSRTKSKLDRMIQLVDYELKRDTARPVIIIYTSNIVYAEDVIHKTLKKKFKKINIQTIGNSIIPFTVFQALESIMEAKASILIYYVHELYDEIFKAWTPDVWSLVTSVATCVIGFDPFTSPLTRARFALSGTVRKKLYRIMAVKKANEWEKVGALLPVNLTAPSEPTNYAYDSFYDAKIEHQESSMLKGLQWLKTAANAPCTTLLRQRSAQIPYTLIRKMMALNTSVDPNMTELKAIKLELERRHNDPVTPLTKGIVEEMFTKKISKYENRHIDVYIGLKSEHFDLVNRPQGETLAVPNLSHFQIGNPARVRSLPLTPIDRNPYFVLSRELTNRIRSYEQIWYLIDGQYHTSPEDGSLPIFIKVKYTTNKKKRRRSNEE